MSKEAVDRVKEAYRIARRGRPTDILEYIHPEATWEGAAGTKWKACEGGGEVAQTLLWRGAAHRLRAVEFVDVGDRIVVGLTGSRMNHLGAPWWGWKIFQVVTVRDGRIVRMQDFGRREDAFAEVGLKA